MVSGLDKSKYQDEMEYIESHGGHTICQVGNVSVLDGKQVNGFSVFKGMDRFLLDNPGLEWVIAHAPPDTAFIVPDRFSSNVNGVLQHYAAIPITPGIALIAPAIFPYPRNLTPDHIHFMNSIAKNLLGYISSHQILGQCYDVTAPIFTHSSPSPPQPPSTAPMRPYSHFQWRVCPFLQPTRHWTWQ